MKKLIIAALALIVSAAAFGQNIKKSNKSTPVADTSTARLLDFNKLSAGAQQLYLSSGNTSYNLIQIWGAGNLMTISPRDSTGSYTVKFNPKHIQWVNDSTFLIKEKPVKKQ